jgi:hypothetical protein
MALYFRQRYTGRIYPDHKRLHSESDMFPVYGKLVDGVFIQNDPKSNDIKQVQEMDNEDELKDFVLKKFDLAITGDKKLLKIKALELIRKWEALKDRISEMTDDQVENLDDDVPMVKKVKEETKEEMSDDYRSKPMHEWNEPELKDYIKSEFQIDGRKLNFKTPDDLRDLIKDLEKHKAGRP